jgi:hypothetical protein
MIKVKQLTQTCRWQPSQWEGTTECGKYIYIRERHDYLTVDIADTEKRFMDHDCECILTVDDTGTNSCMTKGQMIELTKDVLDFNDAVISAMEPF